MNFNTKVLCVFVWLVQLMLVCCQDANVRLKQGTLVGVS